MLKSARILNWIIGIYAVVVLFGYSSVTKAEPSMRVYLALAPIGLLAWQTLILYDRFRRPVEKPAKSFYERVDFHDWARVFFVLWAGHHPLASEYLWGFYLFSALIVLLLLMLAVTASIEFRRRRTLTPLLFGCLVCGFFLLAWERNVYVVHYGVPVIGHFLEKPEYDARYRVNVSREDSREEVRAIADIHVKERVEADDFGDESYTFTYHDVRIKRLYLPSGDVVEILDQSEPLHVGESVSAYDADGESWYVRLLAEPAP